jgi:hypothetical protein
MAQQNQRSDLLPHPPPVNLPAQRSLRPDGPPITGIMQRLGIRRRPGTILVELLDAADGNVPSSKPPGHIVGKRLHVKQQPNDAGPGRRAWRLVGIPNRDNAGLSDTADPEVVTPGENLSSTLAISVS